MKWVLCNPALKRESGQITAASVVSGHRHRLHGYQVRALNSRSSHPTKGCDTQTRLLSFIYTFETPQFKIVEHKSHTFNEMAQKCVHQGCGKEFTDPDEKCEYHPGPPVFHEGQKGKLIATSDSSMLCTLTHHAKDGSAVSLEY